MGEDTENMRWKDGILLYTYFESPKSGLVDWILDNYERMSWMSEMGMMKIEHFVKKDKSFFVTELYDAFVEDDFSQSEHPQELWSYQKPYRVLGITLRCCLVGIVWEMPR